MTGLLAELPKDEREEVTASFLYLEGRHIRRVVEHLGRALFELLQIAYTGIYPALADGEDTVGEVREHFRALQVVYRDTARGVAFRGVRDNQDR